MTPPAVLHCDISGSGAKRTFDLFVSLYHNLQLYPFLFTASLAVNVHIATAAIPADVATPVNDASPAKQTDTPAPPSMMC